MYRKVSSKVLSFLLISVFLFQICLDPAWAGSMDPETAASSADMAESADAYAETSAAIEPADEESYIVGEIDALREANAKQFRMSDGQISKAIYAEPIHFMRNGLWDDIDNTLILSAQASEDSIAEYRNAANSFDLRIAKNADQNDMVSLRDGDYSVSFSTLYDPADYLRQWSGEKDRVETNARKLASEVKDVSPSVEELKADPYILNRTETELTYKGVKPGVDFQYIPTNTGLKENIIINTSQKSGYDYSFALSLTGLGARLNEGGEIELFDETKPEIVKYVFPAPFMYDADGEESHAVSYELKEVDDLVTLRTSLTPAIRSAGQETVFAEIDQAVEQEIDLTKPDTPTEEPRTKEDTEKQDELSNTDEPITPADPVKSEKPIGGATTTSESSVQSEVKTTSAAVPVKDDVKAKTPISGEIPTTAGEEMIGGEDTSANNGEDGDSIDEEQSSAGKETPTAPPAKEEETPVEPPVKEEIPDTAVIEVPIAEKSIALKGKLAKENLYIFTVKADSVWVDDAARAFPVTIDPVLSRKVAMENPLNSYTATYISYNANGGEVGRASGTSPYTLAQQKYIGRKSGVYNVLSFQYKLPDEQKLPGISKAVLRLISTKPAKAKTLSVIETGTRNTQTQSVEPGATIDFTDVPQYVAGPPVKNKAPVNELDITKLIVEKGGIDLDLEIIPYISTENSSVYTQLSTSGAFFVLTYRLIDGLEDYWSVHDQNVGRAGTGYINDYTGNLTFIHDDVSTPGVRTPAVVQHVFNNSRYYNNSFSATDAGVNWRLNYDQSLITPIGEADVDIYPYMWIDGDGTKHFFKKQAEVRYYENGVKVIAKEVKDKNGNVITTAPAADEDGLGLYVVPVRTSGLKGIYPYKIVNKSGTLNMFFDDAGYLGMIRDSNKREDGKARSDAALKEENRILIERTSSGKSLDFGYWDTLYSDINGILDEWFADPTKYDTDLTREGALLDGFLNAYSDLQTIEQKDEFLRRSKTVQDNFGKIKTNLAFLIGTDGANFSARQGKLNASKTLIESVQNEIDTKLDSRLSKRISCIRDAADVAINISYYGTGSNEGKIYQISDPKRIDSTSPVGSDAKLTYGYDGNGLLTTITYPLEEGNTENKVSVFTYDENCNIVTTDTGYSHYEAVPHGWPLSSVTDPSGYKVEYISGAEENRVRESINGATGQEYSIKYENRTTTYTFSGKDDLLGVGASDVDAADNIHTTYIFDINGRTTATYSTLGNGDGQKFLGGGAYTYNNAADKSNNKIKETAQSGSHTKNYLKNHSFERKGGWSSYNNFTAPGSYTTFAAAFDTAKPFVGLSDAKIAGHKTNFANGTKVSPKVQGYSQLLTLLPAGEYTYSGYVKTENLAGSDSGAYIRILTNANNNETPLMYLNTAPISENAGIKTNVLSATVPATTASSLNNGWVRLSVTFALEEAANVLACAELRNATAGTAWFDCLQLEKGNVANTYNILEDSSFESAEPNMAALAPWKFSKNKGSVAINGKVVSGAENSFDGAQAYLLTGERNTTQNLSVPLNVGSGNASYILSGWMKFKDTTPVNSKRKLGVELVHPTDATKNINKDLYMPLENEWFYFNMPIPRANRNKWNIRFNLNKMLGEVFIDDLQLVRQDITAAEYSAGNLAKETTGSVSTSYTYYNDPAGNETGLMKTAKTPTGESISYAYDAYTGDLIKENRSIVSTKKTATKETTTTWITTITRKYDDFGNCKSEQATSSVKTKTKTLATGAIVNKTTPDKPTIISKKNYTGSGRFLLNSYDSRGSKTEYSYDQKTGNLTSVLAPGNATASVQTTTEYSDIGQLTSVASGGKTVTYEYGDVDERLESIGHNGFGYDFSYDGFDNLTELQIDDQTLISHEYAGNNGKIVKTTYGNGFSIQPVFNEKEQQIGADWTWPDATGVPVTEKAYDAVFDNDGKVASYSDNLNDMRYDYDYDAVGRIRRGFAYDEAGANPEKLYEFEKAYNDAGQTIGMYYATYDGTTPTGKNYIYSYEQHGNVKSEKLPDASTATYAYDRLRRMTSSAYKPKTTSTAAQTLTTKYAYLAGDTATTNSTTGMVTGYSHVFDKTEVSKYTYAYTNAGNIKTITDKAGNAISYEYDDLSQLTLEKNGLLNKSFVYSYDDGGNITSIKEYAGTTSVTGTPVTEHEYEYSSTGWKDQLVSYDGQTIEYDEIGNPTEYLGKELTWQYGRKLTGVGDDIAYSYTTDGERLSKTVGGEKTTYTTIGGDIVKETREDASGNTVYEMNYYYDANGNIASLGYKAAGATVETGYFAARNMQGDITALYNSANSTLVGTYTYDAWGKTVQIKEANGTIVNAASNSILNLNPFRYRGYYLDRETGFYYLNSRYYDSAVGRFISPDIADVLAASQDLHDKNLYAYCDNNPIMRIDSNGEFWHIVAGAAIGGLFELGSQLLAGEEVNWARVGLAAAGGALTAAVPATIIGTVIGAGVGAGTNVALETMSGERDVKKLIVSGVVGAAASFAGSGAGKVVDRIGGKASLNVLGKMSPTKLKTTAIKLKPEIKGTERNKVKSFSYLVNKDPKIGIKYFMSTTFGKTLKAAVSQVIGSLSGIGLSYIRSRYVTSW